ncbi:hypothetical protein BC941DRAFT_452773 [Chlamydoabsidia padenii]|nr:hypothetical protein BC941DRAFT_452773 [Chlamydoabsidia padenii]
MGKDTKGNTNDTEPVLDSISMEERKRALKLRKRVKKKIRKQQGKQSICTDQHDNIPLANPEASVEQSQQQQDIPTQSHNSTRTSTQQDNEDAIEYVTSPIDLSSLDCYGPNVVQQFSNVFNNFEHLGNTKNYPQKPQRKKSTKHQQTKVNPTTTPELSKKKLKLAQRYTLDELKTLATVPEVVEACDTSAKDPLLLVDLKSYRNTVPVPNHWYQRQKYLYRYKSDEKPPFELPEFIKDTGIMEVRDNLKKQERQKRQKSKTRERRRPKLGKLDLDYQSLHDAFFRFQTEPHLTRHGDLYYERKEAISKLKNMKPGQMSDELKEALGILETPLAPPPWLFQMQRYGPPPNHPHLKIPGLNAPLPEGAQWGRQKNGWGQVPVDAFNRPLYGDVLQSTAIYNDKTANDTEKQDIQRTLWGELEVGSDDDEDDDNSTQNSDTDDTEDKVTPMTTMDTDEVIPITMDVALELETKKRKRRSDSTSDQPLPKLYDIIPLKKTTTITGLLGSDHVYDLPPSKTHSNNNISHTWNKSEDVTVALDPSDLGNYGATVQDMYEQAQKEHRPMGVGGQELKTMYTDHVRRQAKKKRQLELKNMDKKKDFRF